MKIRDAPDINPSNDVLKNREIDNLTTFEIMFDDLTLKAQTMLCKTFHTNMKMENWEIQPLAIVYREME